jgi:luciferase family oxidoreductase group 1
MLGSMKLSVLDQSIALAGASEDAAIRDTLALAQHCEQLGYHRFWLSEHHGLPTIVGTAPEIVMAAVAARTTRIRIGSAGVMLPHYAALKVAEAFRVLEALAPGRIDLGVGRAPGADMRVAQLLNPDAYRAAEGFPQQIADLQRWTAGEAHHGVIAHPRGPQRPQLWVLGSSDYGARLAAHFGLPYAFAYFFADGQGCEQALHLYRSLYQPSERHPVPQATICVWALAADTEADALHHALSRERWRIDRMRGVLGPLQRPDDVAARGFSADEAAVVEAARAKALVGSGQQVADKLRALASAMALDEIVVNTWAHEPGVRRRSYALLADQFGLSGTPA